MARDTADWEWGVHKNSVGNYTYEAAILSVLMDIRHRLNPLQCGNFPAIPGELDRIERNTRKVRPAQVSARERYRRAIQKRRAAVAAC